jgi:hypothetical protein
VTIAQALFDSSALPFIFKTFHDTTGILFDGGLVNNFPSERLLEDNQFGYVAGFSFDPEPVQLQFTGLKDFTGALVSTMMDNATKQSLTKLPEGDVHYIKTNTSTLDFRGALKNDLIGQNYGGYINYAKSFLADFITRKRMQHAALPTQELARRILHFHDALKAQQKVRVSKIVLTLKSNSLKVRNLANPASVDEFYQSCELVPETPAYTFGFRLAIEDKAFNPGDIHPMVMDDEETPVQVTTLPISPEFFGGEVPDNNVVMFFHGPLAPAKKYTITFSGNAEEILYDMISPTKRFDRVSYPVRNIDHVEEVDLIAYIPTDIRANLSQDTTELPPGLKWKKGEILGNDELARIWNRFPGFYPIGWRARGLKRSDAVGFCALNSGT